MNPLPIGKIASSAAIFEGKKLLLIRRSPTASAYPNHWTFPSGGIEETDQSVGSAVIREVKEEVGLDFRPSKKWNFYESTTNGKRYFALVHLGEWSGTIQLQKEEASEWRFFTYTETKNLNLAFAYREVIDDLYTAGLVE
ncbi:MAG: NUDIX hydrolase [Patescibacteria group bacterium]|jgi:8-oxo-dGTP pyrophosphatase MutT (NUDIX family)